MRCRKNNNKIGIYISFGLSFIVLAFLFPYSGDDWMWGTSAGMSLLKQGFAGYNGRYIGNLLVMILTRFKILQVFAVAGVLFLTAFIIQKVVNKDRILIFVFSCLALLLLPRDVFREAIVWTSGFSNYATSALLLLFFLYLAKGLQTKDCYLGKGTAVLCWVIGFANSLFIEHITLVDLFLGILLIIYTFKRNRKQIALPVCFFVGACLGALVMFQNSAYHNIATESDELHRSLFLTYIPTFLARVLENLENTLIPYGFHKNVIFHLTGAIFCGIIAYRKADKLAGWKKITMMGAVYFFILYAVYIVFRNIYPEWKIVSYYTLFLDILLAGMDCLFWFLFALSALEGEVKERLVCYLLIYAAIFAPLLIVVPIGPRCLFGIYLISFLMLMELFQICVPDLSQDKFILKTGGVVFLGTLVYLGSIYGYIGKKHCERLEYWKGCASGAAAGQEVIVEWKELPYQEYIWWSDISDMGETDQNRIQQFKEFYDIAENVRFDFEIDEKNE